MKFSLNPGYRYRPTRPDYPRAAGKTGKTVPSSEKPVEEPRLPKRYRSLIAGWVVKPPVQRLSGDEGPCRIMVLSAVGVSRRHLVAWMGLPRDWGSGCGGDCGERVVRGEEALPEAGAEHAVVDGAANLEQPIGATPRPAHLLRFVHATIDEEVGRPLGQRCANPQPGPVPFAIVDQPVALPDEVAVQRLQRGP